MERFYPTRDMARLCRGSDPEQRGLLVRRLCW